MTNKTTFRRVMAFFSILMMAIRLYYQRQAEESGGEATMQPQRLSLLLASAAAFTNLIFGLTYLLRPRAWPWAYAHYPRAVRWAGVGLLSLGTGLLWWAHHHLAENFSGIVVRREGQRLIETGPYARIRHPIYTAYLLNYVGGGLVSANWVLTFVPAALYAGMAALRMPQEEALLEEMFGEAYVAYRGRTRRLVP